MFATILIIIIIIIYFLQFMHVISFDSELILRLRVLYKFGKIYWEGS
jgi:hypothetical protein